MSGAETCSLSGALAEELLVVGEQAIDESRGVTCSFCELIVALLGEKEQAKESDEGLTCSPSGTF